MTQDGIWRGGNCPYGYRLVHKGRFGKKNRPLFDLEIDEAQSAIVREIFDLLINKGYGTHRIAMYLNEKYPNPQKIWHGKTIRDMVRNPIFTGRMHMNDIVSEPIESLRIVSDNEVEYGTYSIANRIPSKYVERTEAEKLKVPANTTKASVFGSTLLNGILYCGHCGKKLIGGYHVKHMKTHIYYRPIYRCYNGGLNPQDCDGPRTYSGHKLEAAVLSSVYTYFDRVGRIVEEVWQDKARVQMRIGAKNQQKQAESRLTKLRKDEKLLNDELMQVLRGSSAVSKDTVYKMLEENKKEQEAVEEEIHNCETAVSKEKFRLRFLDNRLKDIVDWGKQFVSMTTDEKRAVLNQLINRIEVSRDYEINILFNLSLEEFFGENSNKKIRRKAAKEAKKVPS